jgi:hypothetical protein
LTTLLAPAHHACAGQALQVALIVTTMVEKVSSPQGSGVDVPRGQFQPKGQVPVQSALASPLVLPKRPVGHDEQSHIWAVSLVEYFPGGQGTHDLFEGMPEATLYAVYCPGLHVVRGTTILQAFSVFVPVEVVLVLFPQLLHTVFPVSSMNVAMGHSSQSFCRPVSSENFPRPQSLHEGEVVSSA